MSKPVSQQDLETLYKKKVKEIGRERIDNILEIKKRESSNAYGFNTIFLCHCHIDKTIVKKIVVLFEKLNIEVYIDWLDSSLPVITNKETASLLKSKIEKSNTFLFLATYHALRSRWCNWELGLAYSIKKNNKLAVLPIHTKKGKWAGNEYLHLYPEMKLNFENIDNIDSNDVVIQNGNEEKIALTNWLSQ